MDRVASPLVLAVMLVLAGCLVPAPAAVGSAATASVPPNPSAETPPIEVKGFDPGYDPASILERVERLRGLEATGKVVIHEYGDRNGKIPDVDDSFGAIRPAGAKALRLYSNGTSRSKLSLGYTVQRGNVTHVHLMNASDLTSHGVPQDVVLAHEFAHVLQFQHGIITPSRGEFREDFEQWTTDAQLVSTALYEGDAMVVTTQYYEATRGEKFDVERYNETLARSIWPYSLGGTPYYYGHRYHTALADSAAERTELIRHPPASSRELLHPAEVKPGANRSTAVSPPGWILRNGTLTVDHTDRIGELAIRHTFRINGVPFSRAAAAADGWIDDTMTYVGTKGAKGTKDTRGTKGARAIVWTTTWENRTEAREFREAWRALLDSKGAKSRGEAVVVPAGDAAPSGTYVITRSGDTVRIIWAHGEAVARSVAAAAP